MSIYRAPSEAAADSGSLHPVYLAQLCHWATEDGLPAAHLLGDAGLDAHALHRPVPLEALQRVLARLQGWAQGRQAGRHLALDLGLDAPVTAHGPLTLLLNSAPNLRHGLMALAEFMPLRTEILRLTLQPDVTHTWVAMEPAVDLGDQGPFLVEWGLACIVQLMAVMLGAGLRHVQVRLPDAEAAAAWQARLAPLGVGVRHQSGQPQLRAPHAVLDAPLPGANAQEHAHALRACLDLTRVHQQAREHQARLMALLQDPEATHGFKLDAVARTLGLSPATLRRHLQVRGCTFDALADASRKRLAWAWLHAGTLPVAEVAQRLGYRDTSNFSRCCRRWFGCTPREMRAQTH